MHANTLDVLYEIFHATRHGGYVSEDTLETNTGMRRSLIRSHAETLKEAGLLFEREDGFQVSEKGLDYSLARWA